MPFNIPFHKFDRWLRIILAATISLIVVVACLGCLALYVFHSGYHARRVEIAAVQLTQTAFLVGHSKRKLGEMPSSLQEIRRIEGESREGQRLLRYRHPSDRSAVDEEVLFFPSANEHQILIAAPRSFKDFLGRKQLRHVVYYRDLNAAKVSVVPESDFERDVPTLPKRGL